MPNDQFREFNEDVAEFRREFFSVDEEGEELRGVMDGVDGAAPFTCVKSSIKTLEQLERSHFRDIHQCVLRVAKTELSFDPTIGKKVRLIHAKSANEDLVVEIEELAPSGFNPEHVVGCKNSV